MQILSSIAFCSAHPRNEESEIAIFAGGCFWCTQSHFDRVKGVLSTFVGYTGGEKSNPSYREVCEENTGHVEAIQITYDPTKVSYEELLEIYFHQIDPTKADGQFCDIGKQYRPIIFYQNTKQKAAAEKYIQLLAEKKHMHPILVEILPARIFYPAEDFHQKYYQKNPDHYKQYYLASGREERLQELWEL